MNLGSNLNVFTCNNTHCNHGDIVLPLQDLKAVCVEVSAEGLSEQDLQGMIEEADRDGDGLVNMEEFVQVMLKTNLFA